MNIYDMNINIGRFWVKASNYKFFPITSAVSITPLVGPLAMLTFSQFLLSHAVPTPPDAPLHPLLMMIA